MNQGSVPVPIVWPHEGTEVYVTGDFSCYSLTMLTGDSEKFCVIWCDPGSHHYRFLVDGSYTCDDSKPTTLVDDILFNTIEVADLPQPISNLHLLSLEDLEKLDSQLFVDPQQELERRVVKIQALMRKIVERKRFIKLKKSVNKIKAWIKGRKQRKKYKDFLEYKNYKKVEILKEDKDTMTDFHDPNIEEIENLNKKIEEYKIENEKCYKRIEAMKNAQEKKKLPQHKKPDPPLISIKEFLTPSKPLSIRDGKMELTPKSRGNFTKFSKK